MQVPVTSSILGCMPALPRWKRFQRIFKSSTGSAPVPAAAGLAIRTAYPRSDEPADTPCRWVDHKGQGLAGQLSLAAFVQSHHIETTKEGARKPLAAFGRPAQKAGHECARRQGVGSCRHRPSRASWTAPARRAARRKALRCHIPGGGRLRRAVRKLHSQLAV